MPKKLEILKAKLPKAPTGRRPIGYRGNHKHGKALYDPVYPTTKIPTRLIPRYPIDWRNGGRFLLCASMRRIENRIIRKMKESHNFNYPECKACDNSCVKIFNRCLCSWFCKYKYKHVYESDYELIKYKGEIQTEKPIFTIKKRIAKMNPHHSIPYLYNESTKKFEKNVNQNDLYKKFYDKIQKQNEVNRKEDIIFSDSDSDYTDSDEEVLLTK